MSIRKNERSYKSNVEMEDVGRKRFVFLFCNTIKIKSLAIVINFRQIYRQHIFSSLFTSLGSKRYI